MMGLCIYYLFLLCNTKNGNSRSGQIWNFDKFCEQDIFTTICKDVISDVSQGLDLDSPNKFCLIVDFIVIV